MGTVYALLNKTKKEHVFIDGVGQKFFELFNTEYMIFITWLLLTEWHGDHVVFVSDKNESEYGDEFWEAMDKTGDLTDAFKEFKKEKKWWFEER